MKLKKGAWAFLLLFTTLPAVAYPTIHTRYQYYEIRGNSAKALRREMNQKGYKDIDGKIYDAATPWEVHWNHQIEETPPGCSNVSVKTVVDVIFIFPKWTPSLKVPAELKEEWDRYLKALQTHEDGHKQHAIKAAQEIEQAFMAMGPRANCGVLNAQTDALGHRIIDQYAQRDIDYDRETQHGKTQDATFP